MNLFLALFWLICAVLLLTYEHTVGLSRFRIHVGQFDISWAWFMLLLVAYNLQRWWRLRNNRARLRAQAIALANEKWGTGRYTTDPAQALDPNFDFTNEQPTPSNRGITTDQPPPNPSSESIQ